MQDLRARAVRIFQAGVAAADPYEGVRQALQSNPLARVEGTVFVIAFGKAARRMAEAALATLAAPGPVLVVTNYENAAPLKGARVMAAGHPVPDENGAAAARAVLELLARAGTRDQVLALISGGGSALLPAPVAGVTLADKAAVSAALLASGADITQINLVRQQLSRLKGGGMARAAAPARCRALILSDVVGDDLRAIASGPTAPPLGGPAEARAVLRARGVWDRLPASVTRVLAHVQPALPPLPEVVNQLIGSNRQSIAAMAAAAPGADVCPTPLVGDVSDACTRILDFARQPGTFLFGGETTVTLRGDGRGGRNQELALRLAMQAQSAGWQGDWVFLSGGTDGRDGPTDAAGGLVDAGTLTRLRAAGLDAAALLARNDSYTALKAAGDLLTSGPTGTNVADLQVLIRR